MSSLAADLMFDFTFPSCEPVTPPSFSFDPSLLELPYNPGHARSSSHGSVYSFESSPSDSLQSNCTRNTTPARSPIRTHGPLLLPKIRSQDQAIAHSPPKRLRTTPPPTASKPLFRPSHHRSLTNPEVSRSASMMSFTSQISDESDSSTPTLSCSPVSFAPAQEDYSAHSRRASSCSLDNLALEKYGFPTYRAMPSFVSAPPATTTMPAVSGQAGLCHSDNFMYQTYLPRAPSPLAAAAPITPEPPAATTTLMSYLSGSNPAPSLVRSISFPLRNPNAKHFWWDIRQIRPWAAFNASSILALPGAAELLSCPVPETLLPNFACGQRHPETEAALHSIYANYYVPKLNAALAVSSTRPLQLSVPAKNPLPSAAASDHIFVANVAGESSSAAAIFGGKPNARVVGLIKSFDRFNSGMRVEGNVKRVEYLRGLAHLHHAMREHSCRYGFILTEIELVVVRNGGELTPHFGYLEVSSVQLATAGAETSPEAEPDVPLTACMALWALCMLAGDEPLLGHAHWRCEIGAPAEGTRRKASPRDDWIPQPQLAEKREAKRSRGWVWPEDAIGRKELGKRGVKYAAC